MSSDAANRPVGQRFSHVYQPRPRVGRDSQRFRTRLAAFVRRSDFKSDLAPLLPQELGIKVPGGIYHPEWQAFFEDASVEDVLDTITPRP